MKIKILLLLVFTFFRMFSQENNVGLVYSFDVEITNTEIAEKLKSKPEFQFSKSFKVFYTKKGFLRFIEKSNNFVQSSVFNNDDNELTLFDRTGILSKKTGAFNKPVIKSINSESPNHVIFKTKTGTYNYFFSTDNPKYISSNLDNLSEHCFYEFIDKTGVIPEKIMFEFGFMKFHLELLNRIEINSNDVDFLNELIDKPNKKGIKKFIKFIDGK